MVVVVSILLLHHTVNIDYTIFYLKILRYLFENPKHIFPVFWLCKGSNYIRSKMGFLLFEIINIISYKLLFWSVLDFFHGIHTLWVHFFHKRPRSTQFQTLKIFLKIMNEILRFPRAFLYRVGRIIFILFFYHW